ncbi:MAG: fructose-bisphosphatase class II [Geodermatophilaceae bacterium]
MSKALVLAHRIAQSCQHPRSCAKITPAMPRLPRQKYHDIERIIEFDFVRATEAAALNSLQWLGRGEKELADAAACDAIRGMFDLMNICGEVVIGEGIKDDAPGIFKGEHLGTWMPGAPPFDIALDPIDGTTNISKGMPNSIACIAAASPEEGRESRAARHPFVLYDEAVVWAGGDARDADRRDRDGEDREPDRGNPAQRRAKRLNKRVQDVVVMMLDRPRHKEMVAEIRRVGASLRMISDGDIAAAIGPAIAAQRNRHLSRHRRCAGSGPGGGRDQMPRWRHAMRDVAARREGAARS